MRKLFETLRARFSDFRSPMDSIGVQNSDFASLRMTGEGLRMTLAVVVLLATAYCLLPTAARCQGTAGPSVANTANYANFSYHFAQPSVSWAATGMTLSYTAGYVGSSSSSSLQSITAGTLTLSGATEYVYWTSGTALSHTGTIGTAQAASFLYTCTTSGGNITGCIAESSVTPPQATVSITGPSIEYCGTTTTCAKTVEATAVIVYGDVTLSSHTATFAALPFTAAADYACTASDLTGVGTASFTYTSGAAAVITDTGGGATDHYRYACFGF